MSLRLVCAWCLTVLREGDAPTSHGICAKCEQEVFGKYHETPSTKLEDSAMKMVNSKVFFAKRETPKDDTLYVVGVENTTHHYTGDYYANEFYILPDHFNPVGLSLSQLDNYVKAWGASSDRTLDSDLQEDR